MSYAWTQLTLTRSTRQQKLETGKIECKSKEEMNLRVPGNQEGSKPDNHTVLSIQ
jgi:hypothetical protein